MDMTLNHLRTTGARMITEVKELNRKLDEASALAEIFLGTARKQKKLRCAHLSTRFKGARLRLMTVNSTRWGFP